MLHTQVVQNILDTERAHVSELQVSFQLTNSAFCFTVYMCITKTEMKQNVKFRM